MQTQALITLAVFLAAQAAVFAAPNATLVEARREFDRLVERTTRDTTRAVTTLDNEGEMIRQLSNVVETTGTNFIRRESARFQTELSRVVNESAAEHVNVTRCVQSKGGAIKELTELSNVELNFCINRYSTQGQTAISQGLGSLNTVVNEVYAIEKRLDTCKADDVNCIGYVLTEVQFQQTDIPRRIQEQLDTAGNKVEANRLYLSDCGVRVTENLVRYGSGIINEVETCIDELIHPTPKPPQ